MESTTARPPATDSLYFALRPPHAIALEITARAGALRERLGLRNRLIRTERLHVTLAFLGRFTSFPNELAAAAIVALRTFAAQPITVTLDHAQVFDSHKSPPLVLAGCANEDVLALASALSAHLSAAGVSHVPATLPHVTVLYGAEPIDKEPVEPISWNASEIYLVRNLLSTTDQETLAKSLLVR